MPDLPDEQAHTLMRLVMDSHADVPHTVQNKLKIEKYVIRRNGLTVTDGGIEALISWLLRAAVAFRAPKSAPKAKTKKAASDTRKAR